MITISDVTKFALSATVAAGTVVLFSSLRGTDDMKNQVAELLRSGAKGLRWVADRADDVADFIESQDSEEYVNQQWAKVDQAQSAIAHS